VYQPLIYAAYRRLLDVKRWRDRRHREKQASQKDKDKDKEESAVNTPAPSTTLQANEIKR
jgi:hypothetical protein